MDGFDSYKTNSGFEIGSGFSENSDYQQIKDKRNAHILMEEQYNMLKSQKRESKINRWISISSIVIAIISLLVSIFKN